MKIAECAVDGPAWVARLKRCLLGVSFRIVLHFDELVGLELTCAIKGLWRSLRGIVIVSDISALICDGVRLGAVVF